MVAITVNSSLTFQIGKDCHQYGVGITEEIEGLIKVYKDGFVERSQIVPCVNTSLASELGVTSRDIVIDKFTNIWVRFYIPTYNNSCNNTKLPLIVYFHGGGFCVGSAAWSCYHEFLAKLAAKASCLIMSVNYRLAPENPLPAAFDDGIKALMWLKTQALISSSSEYYWWAKQCNFSKIFLAGDSAGANIAYNIITRLVIESNYGVNIRDIINPLSIKGFILIQPFFGGEARTNSEKYLVQSSRSALSLENSDTYWRLALPCGANRDHPFCNPMGGKGSVLTKMEIFVCISEMDILKDRNLEFVEALSKSGNKVKHVVQKSVGHAFQILSQSQLSKIRTLEMFSQIKAFISG